MIRREVIGRYRGSLLGLLWSLFHPLFMLLVYTFVFSVVFTARWGSEAESQTEFAIILFAGLLVYNLFAEVVSRSPGLILSNVNYVKKVVFPLDILPIVATGSALLHTVVSIGVLLVFTLIINGHVPYTAFLIPLVLAPLLLMTLGISWLLASLGVYLRDVSHTIGILIVIMLFLSPVFYPISALPEAFQQYMSINPLSLIIEETRNVLIWGKAPDWTSLGIYTLVSALVTVAGLLWFQKTRDGFADVL